MVKTIFSKRGGNISLSPDADLMSSLSSIRNKVRVYKKLSSVDGYENLNVVLEGTPEYDKAFNENRLIPNYLKDLVFIVLNSLLLLN